MFCDRSRRVLGHQVIKVGLGGVGRAQVEGELSGWRSGEGSHHARYRYVQGSGAACTPGVARFTAECSV